MKSLFQTALVAWLLAVPLFDLAQSGRQLYAAADAQLAEDDKKLNIAYEVLMVTLVFAGWPLLAFSHYYFRGGRTILRALCLSITPGLGAFFVGFLVSDGVVLPRHLGPLAAALVGAFTILFYASPYIALLVWVVRVYRHRHHSPRAVPHA